MNSFMSWVGGKKALREEIELRLSRKCDRYVEVFGGGGWVLFYEMRFDSAFFTRVIIRLKSHYYQCIKGSVTNLAYRDGTHEFSTWTALENSFWGHPESLYSRRAGTDIITKNRLYVIEHRYDTRESALSDFKERTELCLDGICEDVFGDG